MSPSWLPTLFRGLEWWFYFHLRAIKTVGKRSGFKEPIKLQKRTGFSFGKPQAFAICRRVRACPAKSSTHEPNSLIFYTSKLKRGSCPTRTWVEYEYFSYFLPAKQKKSNMGRSYTHKNHQLIFISNWLNSAFSRIQERFLLCNKTVSLYLRKFLVWSTLFYVLLNIVYFPRVCDTNLSVWKKKSRQTNHSNVTALLTMAL